MTDNFRIFKSVSRTDCITEPFYFVSQSFLILAIIFSRNSTAIQFMNFRTAFMQWFFRGGSWLRLRRSAPSAHNSAKSWLGLCSQIYLQIPKTDSMHKNLKRIDFCNFDCILERKRLYENLKNELIYIPIIPSLP